RGVRRPAAGVATDERQAAGAGPAGRASRAVGQRFRALTHPASGGGAVGGRPATKIVGVNQPVVRPISAEDTRPLRHAVLRPGQSFEQTAYSRDDHPETLHLGAFRGGRLVAIASLYREARPNRPTGSAVRTPPSRAARGRGRGGRRRGPVLRDRVPRCRPATGGRWRRTTRAPPGRGRSRTSGVRGAARARAARWRCGRGPRARTPPG